MNNIRAINFKFPQSSRLIDQWRELHVVFNGSTFFFNQIPIDDLFENGPIQINDSAEVTYGHRHETQKQTYPTRVNVERVFILR